ncbi:hypothetical protein GCM10020369_28160 [Cryptosporangium minutisporangium]|uniref:Uncharacterized protein n=1 Tax=Cryptosporangium minutisporangium TaxID=113569 RepID=A0ABP6SWM5_9ACTN
MDMAPIAMIFFITRLLKMTPNKEEAYKSSNLDMPGFSNPALVIAFTDVFHRDGNSRARTATLCAIASSYPQGRGTRSLRAATQRERQRTAVGGAARWPPSECGVHVSARFVGRTHPVFAPGRGTAQTSATGLHLG